MFTKYFDNAATTPIDPRVLAEMMPYLSDHFGNAHSVHSLGKASSTAVDLARERVAQLLGAEDPSQIIFTSGATEANNWVIRSFKHGAFSPFEHASVREPGQAQNWSVLPNEGLKLEVGSTSFDCVSVMSVNNEIGSIFQPEAYRGAARFLHSDMTQTAGKFPINLSGIDYASLSAHKFYGPKGIGALFARDHMLEPLLRGGEQESGLRSGTLNVPFIVGMGMAASIAVDEMESDLHNAHSCRGILLDELGNLSDWRVNGGPEVSPYILSLSFWGVEGESVVIDADLAHFAISSGAACSSRKTEPSQVLKALEMEVQWLRGTIRVSFGRFSNPKEAGELAKTLTRSVEKLRTMK